jgi:hypothetical protein
VEPATADVNSAAANMGSAKARVAAAAGVPTTTAATTTTTTSPGR